DGSDQVSPAPEDFYFQASGRSVALPAAGYDYNSGLNSFCWRDSHPLEWQLASLHQIRPCKGSSSALIGSSSDCWLQALPITSTIAGAQRGCELQGLREYGLSRPRRCGALTLRRAPHHKPRLRVGRMACVRLRKTPPRRRGGAP